MQSVKALRRWLVIVALLRLLAVFLGFFMPTKLVENVYDKAPYQANELVARMFATWTLLSGGLCLICARNPCVPSIYGATVFSFAVALLYVLLELLVYNTISLSKAAQPLIVAGVSLLWMGAGWNYYTTMPNEPEGSVMSEPETESQKVD